MQLRDLDTLEAIDLDFTKSDRKIQGGSRPYASSAADGVSKAGTRASAGISGYKAYYQVSAAAAGAAAGAATVNGPASVSVSVNISY
jgi:hypothetical protein